MASAEPNMKSELAEKLVQAGLDGTHWANIFKAKLGVSRSQQVEYLDKTHFDMLKDEIKYDWEEKALRKFMGITSKTLDGKSEMIANLTEAGLDGSHWANIFEKKLGLSRQEQLKNLGVQDLEMLKDEVRYDWEEKAIRQFLGISDETLNTSLVKKQEQCKQRQIDAKQLLLEIQELRQTGISHTDGLMKAKEEQLRKVMDVSKEKWVEKYDNESLETMINKFSSDLGDLGKLAEGRKELSPVELLDKCSAGLALRGVELSNSSSNDCIKRKALSMPIDVKLMNPIMSQVDSVVEFSSKSQSDHFQRSVDTMGYSVAASVKGGGWGFTGEAGFSKAHQEEKETEADVHKQTTFQSRVMYTVIPTAACELNPYSLRLSEEVLQKLKDIENLLKGSDDVKIIDEKCKRFFKTYGSHINAGVLHFGGVNKFEATFSSETESKSNVTKTMVRDALSAYASLSYSGLGFSVAGLVSADHMQSHGSLSMDYEKSELAKTNLRSTRNGGPQEVTAVSLWKMGLVTSNTTWALIDRGLNNFVGIWKLISNHGDTFTEPETLASTLRTTWRNASGVTDYDEQDQHISRALSKMNRLKSEIGTWILSPISPNKCTDYLQTILKTVEEVESEVGTNKYWVEIMCKDICINKFLANIMGLKDKFPPHDVSMIRFLLRKLVAPTKHSDFPEREMIMKWAAVGVVDIPTMLAHAGVKTIPDFIVILRDKFIPNLMTEHERNTEGGVMASDQINASATVDMAIAVSQLLRSLQSSGDIYKVFFLKMYLFDLQYDWPSLRFQNLLTTENLDKFVECLDKGWNDFQVHRDIGQAELESFLIHMTLSYGDFKEGGQQAEIKFSNMLKEIRQVLSPEVNQVLNRFATSSPFNWMELKRITGELAKGNMSVAEEKKIDIEGFHKLFEFHNVQSKSYQAVTIPQEKMHEAYADILDKLDLRKFYPSKISMVHALTVRKLDNKKPSDLPWNIIQNLLMMDFHTRDRLVSDFNQLGEADEDETDDFFGESQSIDEDSGWHLSTLDVLVVIFGCCDNILKQVLAQKLFSCKLAIPFLYPLGSPDHVVMSLWALRTVIVESWVHNEASEIPATDKTFPIVTFVRLGRPSLSKSKLLNDVLSDEAHDTFLNHDCRNGTVKRKVTDGLVECTWLMPTGKEALLPSTTLLLNLRGDASSQKKQLNIVSKVSSVVLVTVSAEDLASEPHTETYRQIFKAAENVVLLLICRSSNDKQKCFAERQLCVKAVGKDAFEGIKCISSIFKHGSQKNASELKIEVRKKLSEILCEKETGQKALEECMLVANEQGVTIDEHDPACLKGKSLAEKVISHMEGKDISDCKGNLLPLQGMEWMKYSKLLKKQHRASGKPTQLSAAYHADQIQQEMNLLRKIQVDSCSRLTPFIKDFMMILDKYINDEDVAIYFLHWMKMHLDRKSRLTLPGLRRKYHAKWTELQGAKEEQNRTNMEKLQVVVNQLEQNLAAASIGLENLFRELGQMYEAIHESHHIGQETRRILGYLPELAARLLLKGNPLELVDGNASNIPMTWVRAVLTQLAEIIGEKTLFVLSVLGVQSSGKSTLLNSMFGLQFAVSAGRCTRGAYMQLVPVDQSANLPFNYIVVVDTEGLRAPELRQLNHDHDNELATLVTGLGDVTIINIKGENTAEIKDILQIAVHAFLRMNIVNKHIKDDRTCIFVHQNVSAANAKELLMHGCQKLQENLDDMTVEAADSENIADIHSFSQIIKFDVQKHVWHFSDLWYGDPPMAPVNPGYSGKVHDTKLCLLEHIAKVQTRFLTTSDFCVRLDDLWQGILADDFVFSFRNSLEVKAYNSLESMYYALEWGLHSSVMTWLQQTAEIKIKMCENPEDLEELTQTLLVQLESVLSAKAEEIKIALNEYFENNNLRDILIQWQQAKLNALNFAVVQRSNDGKSHLLAIKESHRIALLQAHKWTKHETHVLNKAVAVADKLKGEEITDDQLQNKFDTMWIPMVNELTSQVPDAAVHMDIIMENELRERFFTHRRVLQEELKHHPLDQPFQHSSLKGSIGLEDVKETDLSLKSSWTKRAKDQFNKYWGTGPANSMLLARNKTIVITNRILEEISVYLEDKCHQNVKFQKSFAVEVIKIIKERMGDHNEHTSKECNFTILPQFVVKLAVHVSRYCAQVFTLMEYEYKQKHGVVAMLERYKKTAWSLFKNTVRQSTEELIAAEMFCGQLKGVIGDVVNKNIPMQVVGEIMRDFSMTKYYLIVKMMDDLACKGSFEEYESYILNSKIFAFKWITQYTNDKMLAQKNGESRYGQLTKSHIQRIIRCISQSVESATSEVHNLNGMRINRWIEIFCQQVEQEIAIPISSLKHMSDREVVDFANLQRLILDQLDAIETSLVSDYRGQKEHSVRWDGPTPYQQILDKLWGCNEQCPFCREPCADTTAGHYAMSGKCHTCVQHRPTGIGGDRWDSNVSIDGVKVSKDQLATESCNYHIQWKGILFNCRDCNFKCRDHKKCSTTESDWVYHENLSYKIYLQEWDISPDSTNSVSKYWMWFMKTYQHQLKDMYGAQLPSILLSWESVTKEEALADLRRFHH